MTRLQGRTVHIENIATILSPEDRDTELMMRLNTNIHNQDTRYFTDSNGFQMISRKLRTSLPIGANFYPFTTITQYGGVDFKQIVCKPPLTFKNDNLRY
jgi:hypothetical protein